MTSSISISSNANNSRPLIFINTSDPVNPNQVSTNTDSPMFKPPFPPHIEPEDFISKKQKNGNRPTKPPNAFILYRKAFVRAALSEGYQLPMTVVSSMASQAWEQELPFVKEEYKRIAKEAKEYHDLMYPKASNRKQSKRWLELISNLISDDNSNITTLENYEQMVESITFENSNIDENMRFPGDLNVTADWTNFNDEFLTTPPVQQLENPFELFSFQDSLDFQDISKLLVTTDQISNEEDLTLMPNYNIISSNSEHQFDSSSLLIGNLTGFLAPQESISSKQKSTIIKQNPLNLDLSNATSSSSLIN
ncbi:835_t:CDS:2 [Ambispora gerdemannii]|uniref:835_t:CDS:1 n=1 Tax=Ambispora gerdemannii TaxID=144530 RepID=A0A9N8ZB63_9GLOM|nr:835_t:CDS:2 [Ambispora gerdemannii]